MREIKFRAWDKKAKRWIDDFIIRNNGQVETRQLDPDNIQVGYRYALGDVEVVQYTGLKDKNGRDVYEGDIIDWKIGEPPEGIYEVAWYEYGWFLRNEDGIKEPLYPNLANNKGSSIEVIGNIYENQGIKK